MSVIIQCAETVIPDIVFTEAAQKHLLTYLAKNPEHKGVRLSVKKTGCSGFSYVVDYVKCPENEDVILPLSDLYVVCVDKSSIPFLKGMEVDYVRQGLNYKFIFNNPNQTGQCGCGESFTVD